MEKTLAMLKPDCVRRGLIGKVIQRLEEGGFKICAAKMIRLSRESAGAFYAVHSDKPFIGELLDFITETPVIPMIVEKKDAVTELRELIGATDPKEAKPGTIRGDMAEDKQHNLIHASDSSENAHIEINFFFSRYEQLLTNG